MAPRFRSLLLFILLSATADGQCHNHWGHHFAYHKSATFDAPFTQIHQACKTTRFPNICKPTLSDLDSLPPNPSPFDFILITANAFAVGLQTARSMIQSILDASEKPQTSTALTLSAFASRSSLTPTAASPLPSPPHSPPAPLAMPTLGPALLSSTSTTAGPASSMSTAPPRSPTPWPPPPSPPQHRHRSGSSLTPLFRPVGPNRAPLFDLSRVKGSFRSIYLGRSGSFRSIMIDRTKKDEGE